MLYILYLYYIINMILISPTITNVGTYYVSQRCLMLSYVFLCYIYDIDIMLYYVFMVKPVGTKSLVYPIFLDSYPNVWT